MMWTYFPSVLLQGDRLPLRVFHLKGIKVLRFSGSHQLGLQEEQTAHTDRHAQQNPQPYSSGAGGPGGITSQSLHLGGKKKKKKEELELEVAGRTGEKNCEASNKLTGSTTPSK